ncbi:MAG TPA: gliding motility-associated C-terminal domain-containing protein [Cytophagales bacterium]|nr:gliding motility-associated C-terminal domain-containing protein [Cytophagales bacterium]
MTLIKKYRVHTKLVTLALLLWGSFVSFGQVTLPDTAFVNFLKKNTATIDQNNKLILSKALEVTEIYCNNSNVVSIEGIQYFKNLKVLACYKSKLKYIPSLDSLRGLRKIQVEDNQLENLPSLDNLKVLHSLICYNNKLRTLPSFQNNPLMDTLIAGINLFEEVSTVSQLPNLLVLGVWKCKLKKAPDLRKATRLRSLSLGDNQVLDSLPDLSGMKDLEYIDFDQNSIAYLPDLNHNPKLQQVRMFENRLTFEDFLPVLQHPGFSKFEFTPQDTVGTRQRYSLYEGESFTYTLNIDKNVTTNIYRIYKDHLLIDSNHTGILSIPHVNLSDAGSYRFEVVNPLLKTLKLKSYPILLVVSPPLQVTDLKYTKENIHCTKPGSVHIDIAGIKGGTPPYTLRLVGQISKDTLRSASTSFSGLQEEAYDLIIVDQNGKTLILDKTVLVEAHYDGCAPIVITPNGDGQGDELYISQAGTIKIFDKLGNIVKELTGPTYWNGSNLEGKTVTSGYYFIQTPKEDLKVAVVW